MFHEHSYACLLNYNSLFFKLLHLNYLSWPLLQPHSYYTNNQPYRLLLQIHPLTILYLDNFYITPKCDYFSLQRNTVHRCVKQSFQNLLMQLQTYRLPQRKRADEQTRLTRVFIVFLNRTDNGVTGSVSNAEWHAGDLTKSDDGKQGKL